MAKKKRELPTYVTLKLLQKNGACFSEVEDFHRIWKSGRAKINRRNAVKAIRACLSLVWLIELFLPPSAEKKFIREMRLIGVRHVQEALLIRTERKGAEELEKVAERSIQAEADVFMRIWNAYC